MKSYLTNLEVPIIIIHKFDCFILTQQSIASKEVWLILLLLVWFGFMLLWVTFSCGLGII